MAPFLSLSHRLGQIIEALRAAAAARAGRDRSAAPVVLLLWTYLRRLAERFAALERRLRQGRLPLPPAPRGDRPTPATRPPRLPQGHLWLIRLGPELAVYGSQLRHLLADPQMKDLVAASPRAASILRPLCRMLGIEAAPDLPPTLRLQPSPAPPTPARTAPKPRAAAVPPRPFFAPT